MKIRLAQSMTIEELAELGRKALESRDSGEGLVHRAMTIRADDSTIDIENRTCEFVFSTETLDSHGTIVRQDWLERIDRFRNNPVVLYAHNATSWDMRPEDTLPIGYVTEFAVKDGIFRGTVKFVTKEATPLAEQVWQGVVQKSIRATSVGFRPHTVQYEVIDDLEQLVLSGNELYEISICPNGSNHEAVRLSAGRSTEERQMLENMARNTPALREPGVDVMTEAQIKELEKKNADMAARLAAIEADRDTIKKQADEFAQREAAYKESLAKAEEERAAAHAREIGVEAHALVGKKITPAQVESYIKIRQSDVGAAFAEFVKSLPDTNLTEQVINTDPVKDPSVRSVEAIDKLNQVALEAYNKALKGE